MTSGTQADGQSVGALIAGIKAQHRLADKGDDRDAVVEQACSQGMQPLIPSRKNRKQPRPFDKALYPLRHRVENAFLPLKHWRRIASRYAKNSASFLAAVPIRCHRLMG